MTQNKTIIDGVDYGPLAQLAGTWVGEKGLDVSPAKDGGADNEPYSDELTFLPLGDVTNAGEQTLVSMRYHHLVRRLCDSEIFHDQIGHWIYEPSTGLLMHSISIPRGVTLLAGGSIETDGTTTTFKVSANDGSDTFGITQSPFMKEKARTKAYHMQLTLSDNSLTYSQCTSLHIYGKDFEHTDESLLTRNK